MDKQLQALKALQGAFAQLEDFHREQARHLHGTDEYYMVRGMTLAFGVCVAITARCLSEGTRTLKEMQVRFERMQEYTKTLTYDDRLEQLTALGITFGYDLAIRRVQSVSETPISYVVPVRTQQSSSVA